MIGRLNVGVELVIIGLLLALYGAMQLQALLLFAVVISVMVACLLPFGRSLQLAVFLVPCLAVFAGTTLLPISLATVIYLVIFGRYLTLQLLHTTYYVPGVIVTIVFIVYEFHHALMLPTLISTQSFRWMLMFLFISFLLFDKKKYITFSQLRLAFFIGLLVSTVYGGLALMFAGDGSVARHAIARFSGGAGDPNNFGLMCLLLVFFYLPNVPRKKISIQTLIIVIALLFIGSLTVSRTYFLVAFGSIGLYMVFYFRASLGELFYRFLIFFTLSLFVLCVLFYIGMLDNLDLGILKRFSGDNLSEMTGARSDILAIYFDTYFMQPAYWLFFGAGINGYFTYYNDIFMANSLFPDRVGPHNTFVEMFVSFGILGAWLIFLYIYLAFSAEKIRQRVKKIDWIAYIPLIIFFLYSLSLQNLGKYSSYLLLLMVVYRVYEEE
ncbi:hypothetical protein L3081_07930 [Colwellia sp. MSW7]|uniref:O-antigen ligase-related domain-containing protein n=1 Tax=Colwellia maritima TaxID=2912588 RepID=A0ABS9WZB7_9GAMM|nr:O-antigen ligase family protein [Colwellia maritima]MCI2283342.1 hypothetical protein [Colwellia maritima]